MKRSRLTSTVLLLIGSLFCLLWGGWSLVSAGLAVIEGEISLLYRLYQRPREGGPHLWSEEPGMFLFALVMLVAQGGLILWMGIGLGRAAFLPSRKSGDPSEPEN